MTVYPPPFRIYFQTSDDCRLFISFFGDFKGTSRHLLKKIWDVFLQRNLYFQSVLSKKNLSWSKNCILKIQHSYSICSFWQNMYYILRIRGTSSCRGVKKSILTINCLQIEDIFETYQKFKTIYECFLFVSLWQQFFENLISTSHLISTSYKQFWCCQRIYIEHHIKLYFFERKLI